MSTAPALTENKSYELTARHFEEIAAFVYKTAGIRLLQGKEELVKSRLSHRLRALGLDNFDQYLALVKNDPSGRELTNFLDVLTTNKTSFFREARHFDFVRDNIIPQLRNNNEPIRIWSAGCSSGEEPYTLAMLLREHLPNIDRRDLRILATDLSTKVLHKAQAAIYDLETVQDMPAPYLQKYFSPITTSPARQFQVQDNVRQLVRFARLNLMGHWPMRGVFNFIFCRNVMIYFDKPTQGNLVRRFGEKLIPNGHLFIGHSESLTGTTHDFRYVQPALYVKETP